MRNLLFVPILLAAGCSEAPAPKQEPEAQAAAPIQAGQWEMTHETVSLTQRDKAAPAIKTEKGARTSTSICVAEADVKKPQPQLFTPEGYDCSYRDSYFSGGRINATLACTRSGLSGDIGLLVNGSSTADTIDATVITETRLYTDGDVRIETKLTGKRTGACTAAPAKA